MCTSEGTVVPCHLPHLSKASGSTCRVTRDQLWPSCVHHCLARGLPRVTTWPQARAPHGHTAGCHLPCMGHWPRCYHCHFLDCDGSSQERSQPSSGPTGPGGRLPLVTAAGFCSSSILHAPSPVFQSLVLWSQFLHLAYTLALGGDAVLVPQLAASVLLNRTELMPRLMSLCPCIVLGRGDTAVIITWHSAASVPQPRPSSNPEQGSWCRSEMWGFAFVCEPQCRGAAGVSQRENLDTARTFAPRE
ncbi:PREDICTED: uncharacterized protein LOC102021762 isoform X2 [Chinchilla lanigera]|uniref:uncharacterized protein LOC102021762 isoform X2 n=1 Tax=Chinchilla lanigera TaxID=34839 RepID=UPI00038F016D|nr:PREDICTED: uncharacterized protein LOC102021762 isoform X2 [Chinchilla lanigera]